MYSKATWVVHSTPMLEVASEPSRMDSIIRWARNAIQRDHPECDKFALEVWWHESFNECGIGRTDDGEHCHVAVGGWVAEKEQA